MAKRKKVKFTEQDEIDRANSWFVCYPHKATVDELVTALIHVERWEYQGALISHGWQNIEKKLLSQLSREELEKYTLKWVYHNPEDLLKVFQKRRGRGQFETDKVVVSFEYNFGGNTKRIPFDQIWDFYDKKTGKGRKAIHYNRQKMWGDKSYQMDPKSAEIWRIEQTRY